MIWMISLALSVAFAIENYVGCETMLAVTKTKKIRLDANQIAVRGPLTAFWETGMEDTTGWAIVDDFVHREVAPRPDTSLFFLKEGDRVFLLDDRNTVRAEGYFAEVRVPGTIRLGGREFAVCPNRPRLFADADLSVRAMPDGEFTRAFHEKCSAVVIQTLDEAERRSLKKRLGPWLARQHRLAREPSRRETLGNHVVDPKPWEEVVRGRLHVERIPFGDGDFYVSATLMADEAGERRIDVRLGERVLLLDERGQVLDDRELTHQLKDHEDALRTAASAILVRRVF